MPAADDCAACGSLAQWLIAHHVTRSDPGFRYRWACGAHLDATCKALLAEAGEPYPPGSKYGRTQSLMTVALLPGSRAS